MRLRYRAGEFPLIRPHDLRQRQVVVQDPSDQLLGRLPILGPNLLPRARERRLRRPVGDRPHHGLRRRLAVRRRVNPIRIPGDDAEIELALGAFRDGEAQNMFYP